MAFQKPVKGEVDWADKLNGTLDDLKTRADNAQATALAAETPAGAQAKVDALGASVDSELALKLDASAALATYSQGNRAWLGASDMIAAFGPPSYSSINRWPAWLMDSSTSEVVGGMLLLPLPEWQSMDVDLYWTNAGAGAGSVVWRFDRQANGDGEALTLPAQIQQSTHVAPAQNTLKISTLATGVAVQATTPLLINILRFGSNAGDTLANDAAILGVMLRRAS